jgi:hypothetical protein
MRHGLYDIYYSAQHDYYLLIIHTFWLHGVVGGDLYPDIIINKQLECGVLGLRSLV